MDKNIIQLDDIPTKFQIANILTKALPRPNFDELSHKLSMHNIYTSNIQLSLRGSVEIRLKV